MATKHKVGYLIGSLSSTSINRRLSKALIKLAPSELTLQEITFRDLPLYSPDFDANYPPVARQFKQAISECDAILFITPEYNRSIPGALKNAIDWASRPYGQNAFTRKPTGVIGASGVFPPSATSVRDASATHCLPWHHPVPKPVKRLRLSRSS